MLYNIHINTKIESDLPLKQLKNQFVLAWRNRDGEYSNLDEIDNNLSVIDDGAVETCALCPHCEVELISRMFDIDGINLEEHEVCEKCGYGQPALR
ncbi:MAG: hypothetical protein ABH896_00830 [Candidatus Jacksonbacteria bacterium]